MNFVKITSEEQFQEGKILKVQDLELILYITDITRKYDDINSLTGICVVLSYNNDNEIFKDMMGSPYNGKDEIGFIWNDMLKNDPAWINNVISE